MDRFANQLTGFNMVQFLLKDVSELILEFYLSLPRVLTKGLNSWNTKIFPQNLHY